MKKDEERKSIPVYTGFIAYFPDAIEEVAKVSVLGNKQWHPGEELYWDKTKSMWHADSGARHMLDVARGDLIDSDGALHLAKKAWRAMAELQIYLENDTNKE